MTTVKEQFEAAVKVIQSLPKNGGTFQPSTSMMLTFYTLYKQAKQGVCNTSRPAFYDVVGRAKWDAWKQLGNMTPDAAMEGYVNELKKIVEAMPQTELVEDFIEKLGSFYEMVDDDDDDDDNFSGRRSRGRDDVKVREKSINIHSNDSLCIGSQSSFTGLKSQPMGKRHVDGSDILLDASNLQEKMKIKKDSIEPSLKSNTNSIEKNPDKLVDGVLIENGYAKCYQPEHLESNKNAEDSIEIQSCDDDDEEEEDDDDDDTSLDDDDGVNSNEKRWEEVDGDEKDGEEDIDDDEFCDTSDVLFTQERKLEHPDLKSFNSENPRNSNKTLGMSVQTEMKASKHQAENESETNIKVLLKIHQAVEDMQRNLDEVNKQLRRLEELNNRKVRVWKVLNFLNKLNIPTVCFLILWPVVVNVLFKYFKKTISKR